MKQETNKVYAFVEVIDQQIRIHQVNNEHMLKIMQDTAEQSGHTYLYYRVDNLPHSATTKSSSREVVA